MTAGAAIDVLLSGLIQPSADQQAGPSGRRPHDVLVRVLAVSVNPVDTKRRAALVPSTEPVILGHDAAGVVEAVGSDVTTLSVGDEVWYAGDVSRAGTNAELHAVDERIVSPKPSSLSFRRGRRPATDDDHRMGVPVRTLHADGRVDWRNAGARRGGRIGSVMIQLTKALTNVRVIGTASRQDSREWVLNMGADALIDYHELAERAPEVAPDGIDYLFSPHSKGSIDAYAKIVRPFGHIPPIDEPSDLDLVALKQKSIAWHWELMFTRPLFGYEMITQQHLLAQTAELVDRGVIKTTVTKVISNFTAEGIREAHRDVESGRMIGKVVVTR